MDHLGRDPYEVLGIEESASTSAIKAAFKKAAIALHPDKVSDPILKAARTEELQQVLSAYNIISDDERRAQYDDAVRSARVRAARFERDQFIAFALKLYEETKTRETTSTENADYAYPEPASPRSEVEINEEIAKKRRDNAPAVVSGEPVAVHHAKRREAALPPKKTEKVEKSYAIPVEQLNLQVMSSKDEDPRVDIIAVHGLGAIPDLTWKEKVSGINWLSNETMLPSAVPQARIWSFGYDSLWMGKTPIRTSLSTIAYKLLLSLNMIRTNDLQRPILFIGHCFGGLVIERALNLAKMQQSAYPGVFDATVGVVFLGTPHRGTSSFTHESALLAAIAASSELSQKLETKVLDTMTSENDALLDVADDFVTLCLEGGPMITCFYEQRVSRVGRKVGRDRIEEFIVGIESATFDGHRKYGLELDHFRLNKFDSPANPSYIQIRSEISRFYTAAIARPNYHVTPNLAHTPQAGFEPSPIPSVVNNVPHSGPRELRRQRARNDLHKPAVYPPDSKRRSSIASLDTTISQGVSSTRAQINFNLTRNRPVLAEREADLKKEAIRELHEEEAMKQAVLRELVYQRRLAGDKRATEEKYLERLEEKMKSFGVKNPQALLEASPLPDDRDLTDQEIKDKDKWYKNLLQGKLIAEGLSEGIVDEILNHTGETMLIDGVETTVTRMASKWVSTRTLDSYNVPWQRDQNDTSTIIIKRWVPHYEQVFFWDHTQALREGRGRRTHRDRDQRALRNDRQEKSGKEWLLGLWEEFKEAQQNASNKTQETRQITTESDGGSDRRKREALPNRHRERKGYRDIDEETERKISSWNVIPEDETIEEQGLHQSRGPRDDILEGHKLQRKASRSSLHRPSRRPTTSSRESFRIASNESMRSAPDYEEIARRRRGSRALGGEPSSKLQGASSRSHRDSRKESSEYIRKHRSDEYMPRRHGSVSDIRSPTGNAMENSQTESRSRRLF